MTEQVLSLLGLAKKAGRAEVGEEPVGAAARARKARVILTARDAGPSSQRRAFSFAQSGGCLCLTIPADKDALGRALGRSSVAMCAVTDIGLAGAIVKKLAAMEPEKYGAAAEQLDSKAQRAMERRAEQARHEKNLRQGKHRVLSDKAPEPAQEAAAEKTVRLPKDGVKRYRGTAGKGPRQKKAQLPRERFAGSLPVKRGKGSGRKKSGQQ